MKKAQKKHIKFTTQEDDLLKSLVQQEGPHKWSKIASKMPGRTAKQCRDRFQNYLNPSLTNGTWSLEEDQLLFQKIAEYGKKWKLISKFFPNRSHNNVKNRYNSRKYMKSNESKCERIENKPDISKESDTIAAEESIFKIFDEAQIWSSSLFNLEFEFPHMDDKVMT